MKLSHSNSWFTTPYTTAPAVQLYFDLKWRLCSNLIFLYPRCFIWDLLIRFHPQINNFHSTCCRWKNNTLSVSCFSVPFTTHSTSGMWEQPASKQCPLGTLAGGPGEVTLSITSWSPSPTTLYNFYCFDIDFSQVAQASLKLIIHEILISLYQTNPGNWRRLREGSPYNSHSMLTSLGQKAWLPGLVSLCDCVWSPNCYSTVLLEPILCMFKTLIVLSKECCHIQKNHKLYHSVGPRGRPHSPFVKHTLALIS